MITKLKNFLFPKQQHLDISQEQLQYMIRELLVSRHVRWVVDATYRIVSRDKRFTVYTDTKYVTRPDVPNSCDTKIVVGLRYEDPRYYYSHTCDIGETNEHLYTLFQDKLIDLRAQKEKLDSAVARKTFDKTFR